MLNVDMIVDGREEEDVVGVIPGDGDVYVKDVPLVELCCVVPSEVTDV